MIGRHEWGARPAKAENRMRPGNVSTFILHHAAGTYPSGVEAMRRIQRQHQDANGWNDYAYNVGVWDDGSVYVGRGWALVGGHTRGWNSTAVAVCYMGDGRRPVPDAALASIVWAADQADAHFGRKLERRAHRDVGATQCPGDWLYAWWNGGSPNLPVFEDAVEDVIRPPAIEPEPEPDLPPLGGPGDRPGERLKLPRLPVGLQWGSGGLPRIPWLRR